MMQRHRVAYYTCPYCQGVLGDTQCIPCYERSIEPLTITYTNAPLTADDVRRIVREELERASSKSSDVT